MTPNKNDLPSASEISGLLGAPGSSCPILLEAQRVLNQANDLHKALRHLARSTCRCLTCPQYSSCSSIREFDRAVDLALIKFTRDWRLDRE